MTYTNLIDGIAGGPTMPNAQTVRYGETVGTLPNDPIPLFPQNQSFWRWRTQSGGRGDIFTAETVITADITVYAEWAVEVTFDNNGGDTEADPQTMKTRLGTALRSLPNPPTRAGYRFHSWNYSADGTGDTLLRLVTRINLNLTVYAQWRRGTD